MKSALRTVIISILSLAWLLVGQVCSQQIRMPSNVPIPNEALKTKVAAGGPWSTWSCSEGAVVRTGPEPQSPPAQERLSFLQEYQVAYIDKQGDFPASVLLCETEDDRSSFLIKRLIGWVDESDIMLTQEALPLRKSVQSVHRKGMAVITQKSIEKFPPIGIPSYPEQTISNSATTKLNDVERVILFKAPRLKDDNDGIDYVVRMPLSSFYFVFKETKDFVLIGTNWIFSRNAPGDVVLGWLPKVNHAEWSNRIGFEWNTTTYSEASQKSGFRREPGFVFRSLRDAEIFANSDMSLSEEPDGAVFTETIVDNKSQPLLHSDTRMPLLEYQESSHFAKVGWLGSKGIDSATRALNQSRLENLAKQSRNLDVMFLIDHTQTMETHFPIVAEAVQQMVTKLRAEYLGKEGIYGRSMRLSISFYGDEEAKESAAVIRNFQLVTNNNTTEFASLAKQQRRTWAQRTDLTANDMLAELPTHPTFGGGGIEEDVLEGILKAVRKFPPDDSRKLLFVIGDMGDKSELGSEFARRRDAIVRLLANERVPIWFVAIKVDTAATTASSAGKEVAELFTQQMGQIASEVRTKLKSLSASESELDFSKVVSLNTQDLVGEILRAYAVMQKEIDRFQRGLNKRDPSLLTQMEISRLKRENISLDNLNSPIFSEGYVSEFARRKALSDSFNKRTGQVSRRILMSRDDLENLKMVCDKLLIELERQSNRDQGVAKALREQVASVYGESGAQVTLNETLELVANVRLKNAIFKFPIDQIGRSSVLPEHINELEKSRRRLADILQGIEREWKAVEIDINNKKKWTVVPEGEAIKSNRSFKREHDPLETEWYWVRESELP